MKGHTSYPMCMTESSQRHLAVTGSSEQSRRWRSEVKTSKLSPNMWVPGSVIELSIYENKPTWWIYSRKISYIICLVSLRSMIIVAHLRMGNYHEIGHVCLCVCMSICLSVCEQSSAYSFSCRIFIRGQHVTHGPLWKSVENGWNWIKGLTSRGQSLWHPRLLLW